MANPFVDSTMGGPNPRVQTLDNGSSSNNDDDTPWEKRPGGMLVLKRQTDADAVVALDGPAKQHLQDGFGGPRNFMIKVSYESNQHDVSVSSDFTFGDLKRVIAQQIGLEPKVQKLLFRGIEKDDSDHLSIAGVKDNSKVLVMVDETTIKENSGEVKVSSEISIGGAAVAEVRAEVDKLSEKVSALQSVVLSGAKVDEKDIVYLTEMLMRQLLRLDGIEAQGEGKLQRKIEVCRVQNFVETMDIIKAKNINSCGNSNNTSSVTTQWETFESGVADLNPPTSSPTSVNVTEDWEQFD